MTACDELWLPVSLDPVEEPVEELVDD